MARTSQRAMPIALVVIAVLLLAARIGSQLSKDEPKISGDSLVKWMPVEDGLATARATGKPVLFDFTADWCAPCHMLDEQVFRNADMAAEINRRFVAIRVTDRQQEEGRNSPEVQALQQRYSVDAFPTIVFASAEGLELARQEGFPGVDGFRSVMERVR